MAKEVTYNNHAGYELDYPTVIPVYSMTESASALGKTALAFKRWVSAEMIPYPVLKDCSRGFNQYSEGELKVIAKVLVEHEKEYIYFLKEHEVTVHRMWQGVEAYRKNNM